MSRLGGLARLNIPLLSKDVQVIRLAMPNSPFVSKVVQVRQIGQAKLSLSAQSCATKVDWPV